MGTTANQTDLWKPVRNPEIQQKDMGKETLLYSAEQKAIHVLNPTALIVWEMCDGGNTLAEMEQAIRSNYSVPEGRDVQGDIRHTLATLAEKGLIQPSEASQPS